MNTSNLNSIEQTKPGLALSRLHQLWHWLIAPPASIQGAEARRRARFLSALLLVNSILMMAGVIGTKVYAPAPVHQVLATASLPMFIAYGLSRVTRHRAAAVLYVTVNVAIPFAMVALTGSSTALDLFSAFAWMSLTLLVSSMLLSLRGVAITIAADLLAILLLPWLLPGVTLINILMSFQFVACISTVLLVGGRHRNLVEKDRLAELSIANRALEVRTRDLALAAEVGRRISMVRDLKALLTEAVELIHARFDLYYTQIYLADAAGTTLVLKTGTGLVGAELARRGYSLPIGPVSLNGLAAAEKRAIIAADTAASPNFLPNPLLPRTRSEMCVPLLVGEKVVGVLDLQSDRPGALTDENLPAFEALAGQLAVAIENAALFADAERARAEIEAQAQQLDQRVQERTEELSRANEVLQIEVAQRARAEALLRKQNAYLGALHETALGLLGRLDVDELLEIILIRAGALVGTAHGYVYLLEAGEAEMRLAVASGHTRENVGYRLKRDEGLSGKVWASGEPLVINDYQTWSGHLTAGVFGNVRAVAGVPLKSASQVVGVLGLASVEEGRRFEENDVEQLSQFANLASIALDNARLYQAAQEELAERKQAEAALRESEQRYRTLFAEAQRQAQELALLDQVRSALTRDLDLPVVMRNIVGAVSNLYPDARIAIYLLEEDELVRQQLFGEDARLVRIPVTKGITGRVARTGQPVWLEDVNTDPTFIKAVEGIVSEICVPLFDEGGVVGVLNVESVNGIALREPDYRLMRVVGENVSLAISRARLYTEAQAHARELEQAYHALQENQGRLLIAEKMASLGKLTAGIAHEMNTPLAAVRASLTELHRLVQEYQSSIGDVEVTPADHHDIARDMHQATQMADRAAERAAAFVRSIKSQTRDMTAQERRRFNAVPVIQEALLLLSHAARHSGCAISFEPAAENVELHGSPGRLAQVVTNLVTNASDAMRERGGGPITLKLFPNSHTIELQVSDVGCGIPAENLAKIFDPMFTTKPFGEGTGLGLAIVHDIVVGEFGGNIDVISQPAQGTTFTLHFPRPPKVEEI